jgi:ribosomal protein S18 acetylase RimI-like enzyme
VADEVNVRAGTTDDLLAVVRVLDAAMLESDSGVLRERLAAGDVLVAERKAFVVGALVLDDGHVDAVAVKRSYRDRGVGTALVEAAADRVAGRLTADFDPDVRAFYESVGFDVEERGRRLWGVYEV